MSYNTDYTLNFQRDVSKGSYHQYEDLAAKNRKKQVAQGLRSSSSQTCVVNYKRPLSSSKVQEGNKENAYKIQKKEITQEELESRYLQQCKEPRFQKVDSKKYQRTLERGEIYRSYVVEEPTISYPKSQGNNSYQSSNPEMKFSQATATTHCDVGMQNSRFMDISRSIVQGLDKHERAQKQSSHSMQKQDVGQKSVIQLLANYVSPSKSQEKKEFGEKEALNLLGGYLGTFQHHPKSEKSVESGQLMDDSLLERRIGENLARYFSSQNLPANQSFYENQTTIRAEDEVFVFKLSFKFEDNRIVFNWENQKHYPRPEYIERKYECMNYFIVEVFPDRILLFNDFTVQPFIYSKALEKYCIRTHLRTYIPLDDPSKAVTIRYTPSEADTSEGEASRFRPSP